MSNDDTPAGRLLIVSNRLPCRMAVVEGELQLHPSAGGLATSINSYLARSGGQPALWVGTADAGADDLAPHLDGEGCLPFDAYGLLPVHLPEELHEPFYDGFCNSTIWPLFHYFTNYVRYEAAHWEAYRTANALFAERIAAIWRPGDRIWVHDYHLMLLPAMLRDRLPDAEIAFFLHIPFPSHEVLRQMPDRWRRDMLKGLLGADLVGFHIHAYAQHFKHAVQQVLGYEHHLGRIRTPRQIARVDAFPISIDTERFTSLYDAPEVVAERARISEQVRGKRALFSVDRLDYTKGLPNRLEAIALLLEQHPDLREHIVFIMVVVPSRDAVDRYDDLHREIEGLVGRINGRFGTIDWTPVIYRYTHIRIAHLSALYSTADVAVITPIRDGMNLVAKEFVASSGDQRGVLVLSETAGAAEELSGAILVNPNDRQAIADAMADALTLTPEEQAERHASMIGRLREYDVNRWAADMLEQLHDARAEQRRMAAHRVRPATEKEIAAAFAQARSRVVLLDHDGTLMPFTTDPAQAGPNADVLQVVEDLIDVPGTHVAIVSGRDRAELSAWFGHLPVTLSAEHGVWLRGPAGGWRTAVPEQGPWRERILPLMHAMAARCPGALVQEKASSLAWHYRGAPRGLGFLRSRQLIEQLDDLAHQMGFRVTEGDKVVEARPLGADKGTAVLSLPFLHTADFILALGDDHTDEDMFGALPPHAFSVCVGMRPSLARFNIDGQAEVLPFLRRVRAAPPIPQP